MIVFKIKDGMRILMVQSMTNCVRFTNIDILYI